MTVASPLQAAEYRMARHYLGRLRTAAEAVRQGHTNLLYGLNLFDQESQQIYHWHTLAAQRRSNNEEWACLCKEYLLAGQDVLTTRIPAAEYRVWLDSALEAAQQLHDSDAERAILYELTVTHYRLGSLDMVGHYARELHTLGEAARDPLSVGRGLDGMGRFAEERGMYAEADQYYHRALQIFTDLGIRTEIGHALNGLGSVASYLGNYPRAYDYFSQHLELMEAEEKRSEFCSALLAVGDILVCLKDYAHAETTLMRAVNLCRTLGFRRLLGMGLINLGSLAVAQNQLELACDYFVAGIQEVRAVGIQRQTIHGLSMLGYTRLRQGHVADASSDLLEGLQMARQNGMPRYICRLQRNLAYAYLAQGNIEAARSALLESLMIAREMDIAPELAKTLTCVLAYGLQLGLSEQVVGWAGALAGNVHLDEVMFAATCHQLEMSLAPERYYAAFERGKALSLENIVSDILALLRENGEAEVGSHS